VLGLAAGFLVFIGIQGIGGESLKRTMDVSGFLWVVLVGGCCMGGLLGGGAAPSGS